MSTYFLLLNYTDQGIRTVKDGPKRRAAARELAKSFGVEIKAVYLAMGIYDLIVHTEASSDEAIAKFALSMGAKGNHRSHTVKVFAEAEADKIFAAVA